MDNLTHSLVGLALSRAGLSRYSPHASSLLVLSANAPDVDIVSLAFGPLRYFEDHRGYTHAIISAPLLAALCTAVIAGVFRTRLPWWRAVALCLVGLASHLLLDWTNNYGIRLLLPFSSAWFHLDWNFLYDFVLDAVLIAAAVWPWFSRLVSSEIGSGGKASGRGIARFALLFFVLYDGARAVLHHRAVTALESRLYDDAPPELVAAFPNAWNPFSWTGAVESPRARYLFPPGADEQSSETRVFYKVPQTPALLAARNEEAFRYFVYFARFPVWSIQNVDRPSGRIERVELTDLRFGQPTVGAFHAYAEVGQGGKVLRSWFSYAPLR